MIKLIKLDDKVEVGVLEENDSSILNPAYVLGIDIKGEIRIVRVSIFNYNSPFISFYDPNIDTSSYVEWVDKF